MLFLCLAVFAQFAPAAVSSVPVYNGFHPTVRGDMRTVGMSGAVTGLPISSMTALDNPAGLAMVMPGLQLYLSGSKLTDSLLENQDKQVQVGNAAIAANPYPYGVGLGRWNTQQEDNAALGKRLYTREYRLSGARVMAGDRLAFGVSVIASEAGLLQNGTSQTHFVPSLGLGALYQLPHRQFVGVSYTPSIQHSLSGADVSLPHRLAAGYGWIPNHYFSFGASVLALAPQEGTRLLATPQVSVGQSWSLEPRIGARYLFLEIKNLRVSLSGGMYFEPSRYSSVVGGRTHFTHGVLIEAWVVDIGFGNDVASGFENRTATIGVDVIHLAQILKLIPYGSPTERRGLLPRPFDYLDDDLPNPIREDRSVKKINPDVIEITRNLPHQAKENLGSAQRSLGNISEDIVDTVHSWKDEIPNALRRVEGAGK